MTQITMKTVSIGLLMAFVCLAVLPTTHVHASKHSSTPAENSGVPRIGLPTLVALTTVALGRWLTPLNQWATEIRKLNEDELFVQRWMLLNDDPASLEKGKRAIATIQKQRKAIEKKHKRFSWWYYPAVTIIGTGAMMFTFWLRGDS